MTHQFRIEPQSRLSIVGTSYAGRLTATWEQLYNLFGEPRLVDDGKSKVEWRLLVAGSIPVAIYDWKITGTASRNTTWNVGSTGQNRETVRRAFEQRGLTLEK